jgi:hypothetical protein
LYAVFDRLIKKHISLRLGDGSSLGALWELSGSSLGALWELVAVAGIIVVFLQSTLKEKSPFILINTKLLHIPVLALTHPRTE